MILKRAIHGQTPTVYTHMKPFRRLNSYVKGMLYLITQEIKETEEEIAMWEEPEVCVILGKEDAARLGEITQAQAHLTELKAAKTRWDEMAEKLHYCTNCNGCGEIRHIISQDESRYSKCSACDGSGMSAEAKIDAPPVPAPPKKSIMNALAFTVGRKFR